jgi:hypothetical protein
MARCDDPNRFLEVARESADSDGTAAIDRLMIGKLTITGRKDAEPVREAWRLLSPENRHALEWFAWLAFETRPSKKAAVIDSDFDFPEAAKKAAWLFKFVMTNQRSLGLRWLGYGAEYDGKPVQRAAGGEYTDLALGLRFLAEACRREVDSQIAVFRTFVPPTQASQKMAQPTADIRDIVLKLSKHVRRPTFMPDKTTWPRDAIVAALTNTVLGLAGGAQIDEHKVRQIRNDANKARKRAGPKR